MSDAILNVEYFAIALALEGPSLLGNLEGIEEVTYYEWRADDVQLLLRLARKDGTWLADYTKLRVTRLSAQFFELPLHYRPMELR